MASAGHPPCRAATQAGFSMVEMLMAAFIMAVGILGLSALQVMALKATRGSRSLSTAILVAEQILDRAELEGRLSWLNLTDRNASNPTLADLSGLRYITLATGTPRVDDFNNRGRPVVVGASDEQDSGVRYIATTSRNPGNFYATGYLSEFTVQVTFQDDVDASGVAAPRSVRLTRMVTHG
ncbi:MAG: prepilin-type N-terminal cleavage/methylation domain-containing protein [Holophagaceae bacterium]